MKLSDFQGDLFGSALIIGQVENWIESLADDDLPAACELLMVLAADLVDEIQVRKLVWRPGERGYWEQTALDELAARRRPATAVEHSTWHGA